MTENLALNVENSTQEQLNYNFNLVYNNTTFNFSIINYGNNTVQFLAKDQDYQELKKYETLLKYSDMTKQYKYFRMFDNFEESLFNLIELCKRDNIKINHYDENEIIAVIDFKIITGNLMNISLKRIKLTPKEKNNILLKELDNKNKEIDGLKTEIKNIKTQLKLKDDKFIKLEEDIARLTVRLDNLEKKMESNEKNRKVEIVSNILTPQEPLIISKDSKIILDQKELDFLFNAISKEKKLSLKLLYNSETEGENNEKLKSAYIGVNDILIVIKTKKNKRFGAYSHESFENNEFQKQDKFAFLFSLDKKRIYKSTGTEHTIWNFNLDSIDFGWGTDLRLFHNFISGKNYTNQSNDFDYNNESFALNDEKYFDVSNLELYKINFN